MTCQEVRENLGAYLQRKLSSTESAAIIQHLGQCPICTAELENLNQVDRALDQLPSLEPSPSFDARLFARLDELESRRSEKWWSWSRINLFDRYAWSLVVLLISTVGIWLGIRHQQYQELNSLQKVIEVEDRYLGPSTEKKDVRTEPTVQPKESEGATVSQGQKSAGTPVEKEDEILDEDKALLDNLELLQNYDILSSLEAADHQNKPKQRISD